jgi:hypothetical protein
MSCELTTSRPDMIGEGDSLRMIGKGGRSCEGPLPPKERVRVLLRQDRRWIPDRTLADKEGTAEGFEFELTVLYRCSRGETKKVYVETRNLTTGRKAQSPRVVITCF